MDKWQLLPLIPLCYRKTNRLITECIPHPRGTLSRDYTAFEADSI
jgi:hypothetical protein